MLANEINQIPERMKKYERIYSVNQIQVCFDPKFECLLSHHNLYVSIASAFANITQRKKKNLYKIAHKLLSIKQAKLLCQLFIISLHNG